MVCEEAPSGMTFRAGKCQITGLVGGAFDCKGSFEEGGRLVELSVTLPEDSAAVLYVPIVRGLHTVVRNIVALQRIIAFKHPEESASIVAVHLYGAYYGCTASLDAATEAWEADPFRQTFSLRHH